MKKATLNKNVMHDGKQYSKGMHMKPDMPGFKALMDAGHCDVVSMDDDAAPAPEAMPEEPQVSKKGRK